MALTYIYALRTRISTDRLASLTDKSIDNAIILGVWGISTNEIDVDVSEAFISRAHCVAPGCTQPGANGPLCMAHRGGDKSFLHQLSQIMVRPLNIDSSYFVIMRSRPDYIGAISQLVCSDRCEFIDERPLYEGIDDDDAADFPFDLFFEKLSAYYIINCRLSSHDFFGTPEMAFLDYLFRYHYGVEDTDDLCYAVDRTVKALTNYDISA